MPCAGSVGAFGMQGALWKACSNFCSAPAGASTAPNTGRSVLIFIAAGLMTAVILFTAAGIAAPLFVIMVILVLIPWLLWGFSITTERLHDRGPGARGGFWCFIWCQACSAKPQKAAWLAGSTGTVLHTSGA